MLGSTRKRSEYGSKCGQLKVNALVGYVNITRKVPLMVPST
jgi:hypothetical protein